MAGPFLPANGAPSPNPIHILSQEQARCMIAIKELHSQVAVLLQFRNEVLKSLPQLDHKHQRAPVLGTGTAEVSNGPSAALRHQDEAFITSHPTTLKLPNKTRPRLQVPNQTQPKTQSTPGMILPPNPSGVGVGAHRMPPRRTDRARWGPTVKFLVVAQGRNWMRVRPCAPRTTKGGAEDSDDCYDDGEEDDEEDEMRCTSDELRSVVMAAKTKDRSRDKGPGRQYQKDSGFSTDTRPVETGLEKPPRRRNTKLEDDELFRLLDDIEKKGSGLRKRVDELESEPKVEDRGTRGSGSLADIGLNAHEVLAEMERLHRERDQLVDRLAEAAAARDQDRLRLQELANAALDVQAVNRRLEERLLKQTLAEAGSRVDMMAYSESALADVDRCTSRDVHWKPCNAKVPASSLPLRLHPPREAVNSKCGTKVRVRPDRERVSAILRESRVLELQRQLLVAVFENEVLKSRLSSQARKVPEDVGVGVMDRGSRMSSSSSPYGEALRQLSVENVPVERTRLRSSVDLLNASSTPSSHASTIFRFQSRAVPETPTCSCCREEVPVRNKGHSARDSYGIQTSASRDENTMARFLPRYDVDYRNTNEPRSTNRAPEKVFPSRNSEAFVSSDHGNKAHSRHVCNGRIYNCGSA